MAGHLVSETLEAHMYLQLLAYYTLDALLTVEVSISETGVDGAPMPLHFAGRTSAPAEAEGAADAGAAMLFQVSRLAAEIALELGRPVG